MVPDNHTRFKFIIAIYFIAIANTDIRSAITSKNVIYIALLDSFY